MDKIKKILGGSSGRDGSREDFDKLLDRAARPQNLSERRPTVDKDIFVRALINDYGETLVKLGKE